MVIGIIGGGASGMAAALAAAENKEIQVVLMERQTRVGRKLLSTGNGRCNLTNLHAGTGGYHGSAPEFAKYAISQFPPEAAFTRRVGSRDRVYSETSLVSNCPQASLNGTHTTID